MAHDRRRSASARRTGISGCVADRGAGRGGRVRGGSPPAAARSTWTSRRRRRPSSRPSSTRASSRASQLTQRVHRPDRRGQPARPGDQRRPLAEPERAAGARVLRPRARDAQRRAARSRACRSCSRTTSTSPGCRRRRPRSCSSTRCPTRTRSSSQRLKAAGAVILGKIEPDRVRRLRLQQPAERQQLAQRPGAQPVRHVDRPGRLVGGLGRGRRGGPRRADDRLRHRGLDHLARDPERRRRHPPSTGLWSRTGVVPISESQDTLGPAHPDGRATRRCCCSAVTAADPDDPHTADRAGRGHRLPGGPEDRPRCRARGSASSAASNAQYAARASRAATALGATVVHDHAAELPDARRSCRRASSGATSTSTCRGCPRARRSRASTRPTPTSTGAPRGGR